MKPSTTPACYPLAASDSGRLLPPTTRQLRARADEDGDRVLRSALRWAAWRQRRHAALIEDWMRDLGERLPPGGRPLALEGLAPVDLVRALVLHQREALVAALPDEWQPGAAEAVTRERSWLEQIELPEPLGDDTPLVDHWWRPWALWLARSPDRRVDTGRLLAALPYAQGALLGRWSQRYVDGLITEEEVLLELGHALLTRGLPPLPRSRAAWLDIGGCLTRLEEWLGGVGQPGLRLVIPPPPEDPAEAYEWHSEEQQQSEPDLLETLAERVRCGPLGRACRVRQFPLRRTQLPPMDGPQLWLVDCISDVETCVREGPALIARLRRWLEEVHRRPDFRLVLRLDQALLDWLSHQALALHPAQRLSVPRPFQRWHAPAQQLCLLTGAVSQRLCRGALPRTPVLLRALCRLSLLKKDAVLSSSRHAPWWEAGWASRELRGIPSRPFVRRLVRGKSQELKRRRFRPLVELCGGEEGVLEVIRVCHELGFS